MSRALPVLLLASLTAGCAEPDPFACSVAEECVVYWQDCCLAADHVAIRRDGAGAWRADRCPNAIDDPLAVAEGCLALCSPGEAGDVATCRAGRCALVNVTTEGWNECVTDADCTVLPRTCDRCADVFWCSGEGLAIATSRVSEVERAICSASPPEGCAAQAAVCREGRCAVASRP